MRLLGVDPHFAGSRRRLGCSGSPALNTAPLTEEEKQKIREEDKRVEDEERGGSGTATTAKKKRR